MHIFVCVIQGQEALVHGINEGNALAKARKHDRKAEVTEKNITYAEYLRKKPKVVLHIH